MQLLESLTSGNIIDRHNAVTEFATHGANPMLFAIAGAFVIATLYAKFF